MIEENRHRPTPRAVSEEADRNLQLLRQSKQPIPEACHLLAATFDAVPKTLGLAGLAYVMGARDPETIEVFRVMANQFRRCADMLDLACDRHEKENL